MWYLRNEMSLLLREAMIGIKLISASLELLEPVSKHGITLYVCAALVYPLRRKKWLKTLAPVSDHVPASPGLTRAVRKGQRIGIGGIGDLIERAGTASVPSLAAIWRNLRARGLNELTAVGCDRQTAALPRLSPHMAGYLELNKPALP
jgi:hypothetical protein